MLEIFNNRRKQLDCLSSKLFDKIDICQISVFAFLKLVVKEDYEIVVILFKHFVILNQLKKNDRYLACIASSNVIINVVTIILDNYDKFYKKIKQNSLNLEQFKKQIYSKFKY